MRWKWTRAQARLYSAFEVSDSDEHEEPYGNKTNAENVLSDMDEDQDVRPTEEYDDSEELQSNSDEDDNEPLKNWHRREHKKDKKMESKRCGDENTDADDSEGQSQGETSNRRRKKKCPLPHCNSKVCNLPRHMREVHEWSETSAKTVTSRLKLRKKYTFSSKETASAGNRKQRKVESDSAAVNRTAGPKKPCRRKKLCPVLGCSTVTERLPQHLQKKHELNRDDGKYKKYLSLAKVVSREKPHIFLRMKAERESNIGENYDQNRLSSFDTTSRSTEQDLEVEQFEPAVSGEADCSGNNDGTEEPLADAIAETMKEFEDWLISPDCERKDEKTAKQHVAQVKNVLSIIGGGTCLRSLLDAKRIRDVFLRQYAEVKYLPATIKSYLMSLQHFCSFLLGESPSGVEFEKDDVLSLREKLKNWSGSYKRDNTRRRWEKMEEDISVLITPEKIAAFNKSQAAREAIILLGKLSDGHYHEINQANYTLLRDYLIAQIMIDNANRAGVMAYMTVQEFQRARPQDDRHVVRVLKHKTVDTHGPAQIVLTDHLYNHLKIFFEQMRSRLPAAGPTELDAKFFLSWGGKDMKSSQMSQALKAIFQKAGIEGPVSHTLYRKSAVSKCHQNRKEISGNLADLMAHRESTAEKFYRVFDKSRSSVMASQVLHGMMRNEEKSNEKRIKENTGEKSNTGRVEETTKEKRNSESVEEKTKEKRNSDSVEEKTKEKRKSGSLEEKMDAIKKLFGPEIDAQSISIATVREKLASDPILCDEDAKKVYDKLRGQWRYKAQEDDMPSTAPLPLEKDTVNDRVDRMFKESNTYEEDEESSHSSDIVPPTETTGTSKPGVFSPTQVQIMLRLFPDMINGAPISKPKITQRLQKDSKGKEMVDVFTVSQVVNRLKYERKQKREKQEKRQKAKRK